MSKSSQEKRPIQDQYAALCFRVTPKGKLRILMITSRGIGRWIVPKGWPMRNHTPWETAQIEAWEEAGVRGQIRSTKVGIYEYDKWREDAPPMRCRVQLYPLDVASLAEDYPEAGQRQRQWVTPKEAAVMVAEPDLAKILSSFCLKSLKTAVN